MNCRPDLPEQGLGQAPARTLGGCDRALGNWRLPHFIALSFWPRLIVVLLRSMD